MDGDSGKKGGINATYFYLYFFTSLVWGSEGIKLNNEGSGGVKGDIGRKS